MKTLIKKYKEIDSDIVRIISNLLDELNDREKDVLIRRFGLQGKKKQTLEFVGQKHGLTRERIRQIENFSINKLFKLDSFEDEIEILREIIHTLLEEHGGVAEREYFLNVLLHVSIESKKDEEKEDLHKSNFEFLISKLLNSTIEEVKSHNNFKGFYKLKEEKIDHLEEIIEELHDKIKEDTITKTDEILKLLLELESVKKHKEKVDKEYSVDISDILGGELFKEKDNVINKNKILYSILLASNKVEQCKFGYWGRHDSREIKPKTINDKIYLVLKHSGKPMHFVEIADRINEIAFDGKTSNSATVHNELILDDKYVLVGRGQYALKEWGYKEGTVLDVVKDILKEEGDLTRNEIIDKVLENRVVKKTTIILALMNKDIFERNGGRYKLR